MREPGRKARVFLCYNKTMKTTKITSGLFSTNSYLIEQGEDVFLIDAPDGNERMCSLIKEKGKLTALLLTHGHFDHIMGIGDVLSLFPATPVYLGKNDIFLLEENRRYLSAFGIPLSLYNIPQDLSPIDYEENIGPFRVIRTPGHTPGSVSLYSEDDALLFPGDTLFYRGEGRTDLGGSYGDLGKSLENLLSLSGETLVHPGHGPDTLIGEERTTFRF